MLRPKCLALETPRDYKKRYDSGTSLILGSALRLRHGGATGHNLGGWVHGHFMVSYLCDWYSDGISFCPFAVAARQTPVPLSIRGPIRPGGRSKRRNHLKTISKHPNSGIAKNVTHLAQKAFPPAS